MYSEQLHPIHPSCTPPPGISAATNPRRIVTPSPTRPPSRSFLPPLTSSPTPGFELDRIHEILGEVKSNSSLHQIEENQQKLREQQQTLEENQRKIEAQNRQLLDQQEQLQEQRRQLESNEEGLQELRRQIQEQKKRLTDCRLSMIDVTQLQQQQHEIQKLLACFRTQQRLLDSQEQQIQQLTQRILDLQAR